MRPGVDYVVNESGCWMWTGRLSPSGYAIIGGPAGSPHPGRYESPGRVNWQIIHGRIPSDVHLDHVCHTSDPGCEPSTCLHRRCVNPDHLEPVSVRENLARRHGRWRRVS